MKFAITIILFVISLYIFLGPVKNGLASTKPLKEEKVILDDALDKAQGISKRNDELRKKLNSFTKDEKLALSRMIPSNVDNVRLIIDINEIARKHSMVVKNTSLKSEEDTSTSQLGPSVEEYTSMVLNFSVTGTYGALRLFLADLERSLRLVDIQNITFASDLIGEYTYTISLKTYYLKERAI